MKGFDDAFSEFADSLAESSLLDRGCGVGAWGLGFRVQGSGFGGSGFRVSGFRV